MITTRSLPNGSLKIKAILHQIGTQSPYFSITATEKEQGREVAWGCLHNQILKVDPELAPIIALHLSDENGVPMHAAANGLYWLLNGYWWKDTFNADKQTEEKSLEFVASHFRISIADAQSLRDEVRALPRDNQAPRVAEFVRVSLARWKQEACQVIETFGLKVEKS